jgi:hypothetical protein
LAHQQRVSPDLPNQFVSSAAATSARRVTGAAATLASPPRRPVSQRVVDALNPKTLSECPVLLSGLTAVAFSTYYFPTSTQNAYFLHIIARWGDLPSLRADWLYHTPEPYIFFNYLNFFVGYLAGYEALTTLVLFVAISSLGFFAIYRVLTVCFGIPLWFCAAFILILCNPAVSLLLSQYKVAPALLLGGIARQSLFYPSPLYYQPSTVDWLYFVCLWLVAQSRYTPALALSSLIALIHPIMLTCSFFFYCALTIALWREATIKQVVWRSVISLSIVLPVLLYYFSLNSSFDHSDVAQARHIMLDVRTPHETAGAVWFSYGDAIRVAFVGFGCIVLLLRGCQPTIVRPFLWLVAMSVLASAVTFATGNETLRLLEPWRASTVYLPLLTILSLWVLARSGMELLWRFRAFRISVMCGMMLSVLSPIVTTSMVWQGAHERRLFYEKLAALDGGSTVFAHLPRSFEDVRLGAGIPIFVDFKSPAFTAGDLIEWDRRVRLLEALNFSQCYKFEVLMRSEEVDFFILDRRLDEKQVSEIEGCRTAPVLESDGFVVYRVDDE